LVAESVALALSAIPLHLIALRETHRDGLSLLLTAAFLLNPVLGGMIVDFCPYAFASILPLRAFFFIETPQTGRFAAFAGAGHCVQAGGQSL
jgi:uncharacterized membrane protein